MGGVLEDAECCPALFHSSVVARPSPPCFSCYLVRGCLLALYLLTCLFSRSCFGPGRLGNTELAALPCPCARVLPVSQGWAAPACALWPAIFAELGKRFNLEDAVVKRVLSVGISALTEFRFFARDEADLVAEIIAPVKDQLTNERVPAARLKHAWAAVTQADRAKEVATSTLQLDEEELLPPDTLAGLKEAFYKRYKLHLPVQQMPSDRLITKVHRGMFKRSLEVMDMWSVRALFSQQHRAAPKRQKIGEQMYLTSVPDEEAPDHETHTAAAYLKRLWTYMAALAIADSRL